MALLSLKSDNNLGLQTPSVSFSYGLSRFVKMSAPEVWYLSDLNVQYLHDKVILWGKVFLKVS